MKKVNFNELSIRNFLSFGNDPVILDFKKGLHIITGVNRDKGDRQNGLGKSSMMEALYFAVFGQTLREIKKDLIPNTYTNGTCEVKLSFDVLNSDKTESFQIIRTINPSKLFLYRDGEDVTRDSIKNTEEYIHTVLNANPAVFENCVIMTLNNTSPFMSKSKVDKRKFIEGIFNLDIFSRMLSKVRDDYNESKRSYEIELTKMEDSQRTIESLDKQKNNILSSRIDKIKVYEGRKVSNRLEKDELSKQNIEEPVDNYDDLDSSIKKLQKAQKDLEKQLGKLNESKYEMTSEINQNEKTLKKMDSSNDTCPMCKKPLESHDIKTSEEEKQKLIDEINEDKNALKLIISEITKAEQNIKKFKAAYQKTTDKLNGLKLAEHKKETRDKRIEQLNKWLVSLDEDIAELKESNTDLDPIIESQTELLEEVKVQVNKHKGYMNMYDTVKYIVSEEGVKSFIVNKILDLFNSKLAYYLNRLDANCEVKFNEFFEEQIINENGKLCSYNNFSGAEKKAIDFACLFSFIDMRRLQGDVTYNVTIYDELFDSALDTKGIELITKIITERIDMYNESTFVISHRKESVKSATGEVIYLEKKDGITRRLDYNPFE